LLGKWQSMVSRGASWQARWAPAQLDATTPPMRAVMSFVRLESAEELVAEPSTQGSDRLGLGGADGQAFGNVGLPEPGSSAHIA
jgi:hypothetical protein